MSVIYTISENKIQESKANFKFDKSKSYIMSPSFLVQPFLTNGKPIADDATFSNEWLQNQPAIVLNDVLKQCCNQIEFTEFP